MSAPREPLAFGRLEPAEQIRLSRELAERLGTRRSVREFSPDPPPREAVVNAILAAASAPSGANKQPWRFVLVSDPDIKRRIREAAEAEERENYERRFPAQWLADLEPLGTDWRKEFLETAPYLIVIFRVDYGLHETPAGEQKTKHYYVSESVGIAAGFLLAALHWAGLVALTHTPSPMRFLARILERPPNERPYLLIPVGYPAPGATVPDIQRKPAEEVLVIR